MPQPLTICLWMGSVRVMRVTGIAAICMGSSAEQSATDISYNAMREWEPSQTMLRKDEKIRCLKWIT